MTGPASDPTYLEPSTPAVLGPTGPVVSGEVLPAPTGSSVLVPAASPAAARDRAPVRPPDLSERVAAVVAAVPGVARLHGGALGQVATYLPGRRVRGVRIEPDVAEVHVALYWEAPLRPTAEDIRSRVATLVARPVHVVVEDVLTREELAAEEDA